jgi:Protein of unknown function (DUF3592)
MATLIFGLIFSAAGVFLLIRTYRVSKHLRCEATWILSPGSVVRSEIRSTLETYSPKITYEYTYGGVKRIGDKLRSELLQYNWKSPSQRLISRYPVGKMVTVYVNPDDPNETVLEPGGDPAAFRIVICSSYLITAIGCLVSAYGLWQWNRPCV